MKNVPISNTTIVVPIMKGPSEQLLEIVSKARLESLASGVQPYYADKLLRFVIPGRGGILLISGRLKFVGQIDTIEEKPDSGEWKIHGKYCAKRNYKVKDMSGKYYTLPKNTEVKYEITYRPRQSWGTVSMHT